MKNLKKIISLILCLGVALCAFPVGADSSEGSLTSWVREVTVSFDGSETEHDILLVNEFPCMEIGELAETIGAAVSGGDTLTAEGKSLKYSAGSRLLEDEDGHIMMECEACFIGSSLYVPVTSLSVTLCYTVFFDRFAPTLTISTGTNYPTDSPLVYKASDFGAVGDGVTYDDEAIREAIAAVIREAGGAPSKLVLDEGKTYRLGERNDYWAHFLIRNAQNFTFDGNGSTLLIERPINSFFDLQNCKNVKVLNVNLDYDEPAFSQGEVKSVDTAEGYVTVEIGDNYPLPPTDEWVKTFAADDDLGGWNIFEVIASGEKHIKFTSADNFRIETVESVGGRTYKFKVKSDYVKHLENIVSGDMLVFKSRYLAYDFGSYQKGGKPHNIFTHKCSDILFENVHSYYSPIMFALVSASEGRVRFSNCGFGPKPGTDNLISVNQDGIHCVNNRVGVIVENCTFDGNMDDMINTKTGVAKVLKATGTRTFKIDDGSIPIRRGDEVLFYNEGTTKLLGRAYVSSYSSTGGYVLTTDRDISGVVDTATDEENATTVYVNGTCGSGNVIRNNTFLNCRRHAYLCRSTNSVFENNIVTNCAGSAFAAMNETGTYSEGPFPSACTVRNNKVTGDGNTSGYYPIEIKSFGSSDPSDRVIDGCLVEDNEISVPNKKYAININSVKDLYILGNTLSCDKALAVSTRPVNIRNCEIAVIDGLSLDYTQDVSAAVTIAASIVDEENIKNITVERPNFAKDYFFEDTSVLSEDFTNAHGSSMPPASFVSIPATYYSGLSVSYAERDGGYALKLSRTGSKTWDYLLTTINVSGYAAFSGCDGQITYEFDIYLPKYQALAVQSMYELSDGTNDFADILNFNYGDSGNDQNVYSSSNQKLAAYSHDAWNKVKISYDFKDRKVYYFLNDAQIGQDEFESLPDGGQTKMLRLVCNSYTGRYIMFDNFKVTAENLSSQISLSDLSATTADMKNIDFSATVRCSAPKNSQMTVLAVGYREDGTIAAVKSVSTRFGVGTSVFAKSFDLGEVMDSVKIFVFEDLDTLVPVCGVIIPSNIN